MKSFSVLLTFLMFIGIGSVIAQDDDYVCFQCPPSEPITRENISRLRGIGGTEGTVFDISFSTIGHNPIVLEAIGVFSYVESIRFNMQLNRDFAGWDIHSILRGENYTQIAYHPEETYVAIGTDMGEIIFWSTDEPIEQVYASQGQASIREILYHPTGDGVLTLEGNNMLGWHDMTDDGEYFSVANTIQINAIALSPDGEWLAVATNQSLQIYAVENRDLLTEVQVETPINSLQFNPDDNGELFTLTDEVSRWGWDAEAISLTLDDHFTKLPADTAVLTETEDYEFTDVTINPDGSVLVSLDNQYCLRTWDLVDQMEIISVADNAETCAYTRARDTIVSDIAFSPDGLYLLVASTLLGGLVIP